MRLAKIMGLVAVAFLVTGSLWADQPTPAPQKLSGAICKIDGAKLTVKPTRSRTTIEVTTDDQTTVTVDGKTAKVADLKVGMSVTVTPATGTATNIEAKKAGGG